jgi:hypothetical protein
VVAALGTTDSSCWTAWETLVTTVVTMSVTGEFWGGVAGGGAGGAAGALWLGAGAATL